MSTNRMERSPESWAGMAPSAVADGSRSQIMYALQDAKHDIAFLLEDLAAHEASNRIRGENLETLRAENAKLREALVWSAAVLQCLANGSLSESSTFTVNGEKRSLADVLDLADAALGESNGVL